MLRYSMDLSQCRPVFGGIAVAKDAFEPGDAAGGFQPRRDIIQLRPLAGLPHGLTQPIRPLVALPPFLLLAQPAPPQLPRAIPLQVEKRRQRQFRSAFHGLEPAEPMLMEAQADVDGQFGVPFLTAPSAATLRLGLGSDWNAPIEFTRPLAHSFFAPAESLFRLAGTAIAKRAAHLAQKTVAALFPSDASPPRPAVHPPCHPCLSTPRSNLTGHNFVNMITFMFVKSNSPGTFHLPLA